MSNMQQKQIKTKIHKQILISNQLISVEFINVERFSVLLIKQLS